MPNCRFAPSKVALGLALMLGGLGTTAAAQDTLLVGGQFVSAARTFGLVLGPAPSVPQQDIFGGGRYGLVGGAVFDGRTGRPVHVPVGLVAAVDAARPRLFEVRGDAVWAVNVATSSAQIVLPSTGAAVRRCAHANSADVLLCGKSRPDGRTDVIAVDLATGTQRLAGTIDLAPDVFGPLAVWITPPDGSRLYFGARSSGVLGALAALDTSNGTVVVSTEPGAANLYGGPGVVWDDANERVIVLSDTVSVLSKDLATVVPPTLVGGSCLNAQVSAHTGRLYLGWWADFGGFGEFQQLNVFDSTTYVALAPPARTAGVFASACRQFAVLTAPGAPRSLSAQVTGRDVAIAWTNVGGASGFVLEAGVAPGRSDVQVYLGPDPRATFSNVPPGTYYVRVRGGNEFGGGRPSQEIRVVVP
jgi:hypothetical protein